MKALALIHEDQDLVAVNKPAGLAAHRSSMVARDDDYLVDQARALTGRTLYLAHRLDRATSGVVLFAASKAVAAQLGQQFMARDIAKSYLAVVRGWLEPEGLIEQALDAPGRPRLQPSSTRYRCLATTEQPWLLGRYQAQRYSLAEVEPLTGRYRQIRRHFHHISHHVIGDTSEGRGDHNRLFRQHLGVHRMLLHAWRIALRHPASGAALSLQAPWDVEWQRVLAAFGWSGAPGLAGALAPVTNGCGHAAPQAVAIQ